MFMEFGQLVKRSYLQFKRIHSSCKDHSLSSPANRHAGSICLDFFVTFAVSLLSKRGNTLGVWGNAKKEKTNYIILYLSFLLSFASTFSHIATYFNNITFFVKLKRTTISPLFAIYSNARYTEISLYLFLYCHEKMDTTHQVFYHRIHMYWHRKCCIRTGNYTDEFHQRHPIYQGNHSNKRWNESMNSQCTYQYR